MRNVIKRTVAVMAVFCTLFTGCADSASSGVSDTAPLSRDIFAMDTYMNLKAYGSNADAALDKAVERIYALEAELSVTDENSDISRLNASAGQPVDLSDDCVSIINAAISYGDLTSGALDITLYPVVRAWGFTTGEYRIPTDTELAGLLTHVDYKAVTVDDTSVAIPDQVSIDLGALAKGYTSNEVMDIMRENGVTSAIVSLGGNVQVLGAKPDGSEWKVSVRDPFSPDTDMCIIGIKDKAVITSGNYERYFTGDDGNIYWHIIDPADGYPADNGIVSATVIGSSGLECDALSTALFVAGKEKATEIWKQTGSFDMILVTDDARIYYTDGLEDTFQNISSMPAEVIRP